jgi:D-cysteine desulfhydrase/L-cysteate sulfo-lyase
MSSATPLQTCLDRFPKLVAGHLPTPLEPLRNMGAELGINLWVKRDDCTGVGFGGNKVRQLRYYLGAAQAAGADTVLITGAVQSNFVRTTASMAGICGMACHVQLEERVPNVSDLHRSNGNVLLDKLTGANVHSYPEGEDEAGADAEMRNIANQLRAQGKNPFVIPLGADQPPRGALGYAEAALELADQLSLIGPVDEIIIPSGSALTHIGVLVGLRALGIDIPVLGVCVRRQASVQKQRVRQRVNDLIAMMEIDLTVSDDDIRVDDGVLAPGYGQLNPLTRETIFAAAKTEGLFLDPVYSGKTLALLRKKYADPTHAGKTVLFWHTGGQPALFAYADQLIDHDA